MSLFHTADLARPSCGAASAQTIAHSVAANRRPDLRAAILDGTFQVLTCRACGISFRLAPPLIYMDVAQGSWILTCPGTDRPLWDALEAEALDIFNDSFGTAPPATQALGARFVVRMTFGWSGLRETLLCQDYGIDGTVLELMKLALLRTTDAAYLQETAALRLVGRKGDGTLLLAGLDDETEGADEALEVPAALLNGIAADTAVEPEPTVPD
jgi:hypothetical protein